MERGELAEYVIVRFIPDPDRGETVNMGIVVRAGDTLKYRFASALPRLSQYSEEVANVAKFLASVLDERRHLSHRLHAWLKLVVGEIGLKASVSEPKAIQFDGHVNDLLEELFDRLVGEASQSPRAKAHAWVRAQIIRAFRAHGVSIGETEDCQVQTKVSKRGKAVTHSIDFVYRNGCDHFIWALSFEAPERARESASLTTFSIVDLRHVVRSFKPVVIVHTPADEDARVASACRILEAYDSRLYRLEEALRELPLMVQQGKEL